MIRRRSLIRHAAATAAILAGASLAPRDARAAALDLHLVLAVDSSSSVTMDEYYLQLEGYAHAFADPELWSTIAAGPARAIAVALFEWSGPEQQALNFPWRILDSAETLAAFAKELALAPRLVIGGETAIGDALLFALELLRTAPGHATRQVVDVSGDGSSNRGNPPERGRDALLAHGATINGLAVLDQDPDLAAHYTASVIGGPGHFLLAASDYADFQGVIRRKLLREIRPLVASKQR